MGRLLGSVELYYLMLTVSLVAIFLGMYSNLEFGDSKSLDVVNWELQIDMRSLLFLQQFPKRIVNLPMNHGIRQWTFDYFQQADKELILDGVSCCKGFNMLYEKPEFKIEYAPIFKSFSNFDTINMTIRDFMDFEKWKRMCKSLHYNGNLHLRPWRHSKLYGDVPNLETVINNVFKGFIRRFEVDYPLQVSSFIWLGSKDTNVNLHYDSVHNIYLQIEGCKRISLYPPDAVHSMYLYPYLHPNSRHSRIVNPEERNIEYPMFSKYIKDAKGEFPVKLLLCAGDVLYIPPYWGHYIQVVDSLRAMSVSLWHTSEESQVFKTIQDALFDRYSSYDLMSSLLLVHQWILMYCKDLTDFTVIYKTKCNMISIFELISTQRYKGIQERSCSSDFSVSCFRDTKPVNDIGLLRLNMELKQLPDFLVDIFFLDSIELFLKNHLHKTHSLFQCVINDLLKCNT